MKNLAKFAVIGIFLLILSMSFATAFCPKQEIGENLEVKFQGIVQGKAQQVIVNSVPGAGQAMQAVEIAKCFAGGTAECIMNMGMGQIQSSAWSEIGKYVDTRAIQTLQNLKDMCGEAKNVEINGSTGDIESGEILFDEKSDEPVDIGNKVLGLKRGEVSVDNGGTSYVKIKADKSKPDTKTLEVGRHTGMVMGTNINLSGVHATFLNGTKINLKKTGDKKSGYFVESIEDHAVGLNGNLGGNSSMILIREGRGEIKFSSNGEEGKTSSEQKRSLWISEAKGITVADSFGGTTEYKKVANYQYRKDGENISFGFNPQENSEDPQEFFGFATYKHGESEINPSTDYDRINWDSNTNKLEVITPREEPLPKVATQSIDPAYTVAWWVNKSGFGPAPDIARPESEDRLSVNYGEKDSGIKSGGIRSTGILVTGTALIEYDKEGNPVSFEGEKGTAWVNVLKGKYYGRGEIFMIGGIDGRAKVLLEGENGIEGKGLAQELALAEENKKSLVMISTNDIGGEASGNLKYAKEISKYSAWGDADFYVGNEETLAHVSGNLNGFNAFSDGAVLKYNSGASSEVKVKSAIGNRELEYIAREAGIYNGPQTKFAATAETPEDLDQDLLIARGAYPDSSSADTIPKQFDDYYTVKNQEGDIVASSKDGPTVMIPKNSSVEGRLLDLFKERNPLSR